MWTAVLLAGVWYCDGPLSPGLSRPGTGLALEFASWEAGPDGAPPAATAQLRAGAEPVVRRAEGGCDAITVG